ncbi:MAG: hypothetical protein U0R71_01715 [Solirubrobacterales bacterium]
MSSAWSAEEHVLPGAVRHTRSSSPIYVVDEPFAPDKRTRREFLEVTVSLAGETGLPMVMWGPSELLPSGNLAEDDLLLAAIRALVTSR